MWTWLAIAAAVVALALLVVGVVLFSIMRVLHAHSDDADQPFQRIPISHSDRSRSVWCGVSAPLDAFLISVFSPGVKQG